jgi:hypothetical protein
MAAATKLPKVTLGAAQQIAEDRFLVGAIPVEAPLGQVAGLSCRPQAFSSFG